MNETMLKESIINGTDLWLFTSMFVFEKVEEYSLDRNATGDMAEVYEFKLLFNDYFVFYTVVVRVNKLSAALPLATSKLTSWVRLLQILLM